MLYACSGMYDNVNPYYDEGEINYIAKVDSVSTNAGNNRVKFTWLVNTDPRIKELFVTWSDGKNDTKIPIDFSQLNENRFYSVILEPVEEGNHIFYLYHTGKGDRSLATEVEVRSYGEKYRATLEPRSIRSVTMQGNKATITWRNVVANCVVEISYTNTMGVVSKQTATPTELKTVIEDVLPGSTFSYVSTYTPEKGAMDVFSVNSETINFPE